MYEFWYHYFKPNYGEKAKLRYMNTDSFIASIKRNYIYKGITNNAETRFDTSNFELEWVLLIDHCLMEKTKKVIRLMKDGLGRKIMTKLLVKAKSKRQKKVSYSSWNKKDI